MSTNDHSNLLEFIERYSYVLGKETILQITQKALEEAFPSRAPKLITILERRLDGENIPTVKKYISYSKWGLYYYGGLCSRSALADFEGAPLIKIEERIDSNDVSWSVTGTLFECSEFISHDSVSIDDVFSLIKRDWMNVDENNLCVINETIKRIHLSKERSELTIETSSSRITAKIDNLSSFGDDYSGGFVLCENGYQSFTNSLLRRITLGETFLNSKAIELLGDDLIGVEETESGQVFYSIQADGSRNDSFPEILFINFETNCGTLQYVLFNYHDGMWPHDVSVSINDQIIYKKIM